MGNKTYLEVLNRASSFLEEQGKEAKGAEFLMLGRLSWGLTDLVRHRSVIMSEIEQHQFSEDVKKFASGIPPQYILGEAEFYGRSFKVTPDTLIPRPETEELVEKCLSCNNQKNPLKVLDIGTGTGAIAVTLKKEAPLWELSAVDISEEALNVAKDNSQRQQVAIRFFLGDLTEPVRTEQFDIIISNPPYIGTEEWKEMDDSVRQHEPSLALFAEGRGLAIYERLSLLLPDRLKPKGKVYLEIGYKQGEAVSEMMAKAFPEKEINLYQDLSGHDRIIEICG